MTDSAYAKGRQLGKTNATTAFVSAIAEKESDSMSRTSPFKFKQLPRPTPPSASVPVDRFNRVIEVGQLVLHKDLVFQVAGIDPVMDPRLPKGMVRLHLRTEMPVTFEAGMPCSQLVIVADAPKPEDSTTDQQAIRAAQETVAPSGLVLTDPQPPASTEEKGA